MNYNEKLDLILAKVTALEAVVASLFPADPIVVQAGGLYDFVRPPADEPPYGLGVTMTVPDAAEAIQRARYGVNWRGDLALSPAERDARWAIIEKLKARDPDITPFYEMLDPTFCGYGLLSGAFEPHTADGNSFGATKAQREKWAGASVASFLEEQFAIGGTPGIAGE